MPLTEPALGPVAAQLLARQVDPFGAYCCAVALVAFSVAMGDPDAVQKFGRARRELLAAGFAPPGADLDNR